MTKYIKKTLLLSSFVFAMFTNCSALAYSSDRPDVILGPEWQGLAGGNSYNVQRRPEQNNVAKQQSVKCYEETADAIIYRSAAECMPEKQRELENYRWKTWDY